MRINDIKSTFEEFIINSSYIKNVDVNFDLPLRIMGIGDVEFIAFAIQIEKYFNFNLLHNLNHDNLLSYTLNQIIEIINKKTLEEEML